MKIRYKINLFILLMLAVSNILLMLLGYFIINQMSYQLYAELLTKELNHVIHQDMIRNDNDFNSTATVHHQDNKNNLSPTQLENIYHHMVKDIGNTTYFYVFDSHAQVILHKDYSPGQMFAFDFAKDMLQQRKGKIQYIYQGKPYFAVFSTLPTGWMVVLAMTEEEMFTYRDFYFRWASLISLVLLLTILLFTLVFSRRLTKKIQAILRFLKTVKTGNLTIPPLTIAGHDELNLIQTGINAMVAKVVETTTTLNQFKTTLDLTLDCIFILDAETTKFIYVNQGAINQVGYTYEELLQMTPLEFAPLETKESLGKIFLPLLNGSRKSITVESVHQHKQGKRIPVEVFIQYIQIEGQRDRFVAIARNISDRKQAEANLLQTTEEINQVMQLASQGDFKQRIQLTDKTGLFKTFAEAINQTLEFNQQIIEELTQVIGALAQGDLTQTIKRNYAGALEQLKNDINTTIAQLTNVVNLIQPAATALTMTATHILQGSVTLNNSTDQQMTSLQQTTIRLEQMMTILHQMANNARQATHIAMTARAQASQGQEVIKLAVMAMNEINASSNKIADITGVIDDIAFQTNLLALNAAVEAARAGQHGRGFAVVATEVRHLAQRSATAAKKIKEIIKISVNQIAQGTERVNQSGTTLEDIVSAVIKFSEIIVEIAASGQEQSSNIEQINKVIKRLDKIAQQNASLVEESATTSEILTEQANQLKEHIAFFYDPKIN
ncbi:MAG: PAS domain S-box protein [Thioploca sp.]|nr:PAS domain S-box protein [Thioploca sp.]